MSTLANADWALPPEISSNGLTAARGLRSYVWAKGGAKNERELKLLGEKVPGARWCDYMRICLFERVDWGDGTPCSVHTVATLHGCGCAIDNAMLLMTSLRAERQAGGESKLKTRYRVMVELKHVEAHTVCWIDVESGEVITGEFWKDAEKKRLAKQVKTLTEAQLEGTACVVCGGTGGSLGMLPLDVETKTSTTLFHCCGCSAPALPDLKSWVSNSGAAIESGVAA